MSHDLEQQLTDHLHGRARHHAPAHDSLERVTRIAKRRSLRNRIAIGACGLAMLAGVGALIPTNSDPGALVTANDPVEELPEGRNTEGGGTEDQSNLQTADPELTELQELSSQTARNPNSNWIIGDGRGGFVAFGPQSTAQATDGIVQIVRSTNGEDWFEAGQWQLPKDSRLRRVLFVDGHFVAVVERDSAFFSSRLPATDPWLAISADLTEWRWVDLDLAEPDSAQSEFEPQHTIIDVALNGDDTMVVVLSDPGAGFIRATDRPVPARCGGSRIGDERSVFLCDGTVIPAEAPHDGFQSPTTQRVLRSIGGGAATETARTEMTNEDQFNRFNGRGQQQVSAFERDFLLTTLGPPNLEWAALVDSGEALLLVRAVESSSPTTVLGLVYLDDRFGSLLVDDGEATFGEFPEEVVAPSEFTFQPRLGHGPAGWVAVISDLHITFPLRETDEWVVRGDLGGGHIVVDAIDGSEQYWYTEFAIEGPNPYIERGLFGEVRVYKPGSGELLVELNAALTGDADSNSLPAARLELKPSATGDRSLTTNGWTLSGDAITGPLVLTSPTGDQTEFADGFVFDNGDLSDGVEADFGYSSPADHPYFLLASAVSPLRFYDDDGSVLVEFSAQQIFEDMVQTEYRWASTTNDPPVTKAWWLFSPDGIDWEVIWSATGRSTPPTGTVAVGDDEILIMVGNDLMRIPLDE